MPKELLKPEIESTIKTDYVHSLVLTALAAQEDSWTTSDIQSFILNTKKYTGSDVFLSDRIDTFLDRMGMISYFDETTQMNRWRRPKAPTLEDFI
jgi:hypothetical protein